MIPGLSSLVGGGISAGGGGPSNSAAGDASAGLNNSFQYNAGFTVGGSGKTSASQTAEQTPTQGVGQGGGGSSNMLIYVSLGLAALTLVVTLIRK